MVRSFDWRDVGLVKALADRGVCLDSETGLTQGAHPLQQALLGYLMPMAGPPTFIWKADGRGDAKANGQAGEPSNGRPAAFGQLSHRPGDEQARVLFMAPAAEAGTLGWHAVIERLAAEAGERHAQTLLAEVDDKSPEFEALRQAGFAVYARQSLWKLGPEALPTGGEAATLRPAARADAIPVTTLYSNLVPRLVQQVEPGPQQIERGYVFEAGGEVLAYLDVRRGPQGIWVEPFIHPEAYYQSEAVMLACLQLVAGRKDKPIYVCVRRYQDWLQAVMARVGFAPLGSQAVLVKRLAVRLAEPLLKPLPAVEGKVASPITSARFSRYDDEQRAANHHRLLSVYWWRHYAKTNHR